MAAEKPRRICRTPEECFQAGQHLVRERGDKLTPERAALVAAILRPYLRREPAA